MALMQPIIKFDQQHSKHRIYYMHRYISMCKSDYIRLQSPLQGGRQHDQKKLIQFAEDKL